jgi:beta-glucanase (GH16 family)
MKKTYLLREIIFLLAIYCCVQKADAQLQPLLFQLRSDSIIQFNYHFGDEFNTGQIDADKWFDRYPWGGLLVDQRVWASPEMVVPYEGYVNLKAEKTGEMREFQDWMINRELAKQHGTKIDGNKVQLDYLTSCLWSKQTFRYGYFECRAKCPTGKGLWPAFWLYGQNQKDEIDFMENKGERPSEIHVDVHCPNKCDQIDRLIGKTNWGAWVKLNKQVLDEWVVYSGLWTPEGVIFYADGVPISYFKGVFGTEMNVIVNLSVARDGFAFKPGPDEKTIFPAEFLVDYVRVWKLPEDGEYTKRRFRQFSDENKTIQGRTLNSPKVTRTNRYVNNKKLFRTQQGFVSLTPVNERFYQIHSLGMESGSLVVILKSEKGEVLKTQTVKSDFELFNMQNIPSGNYILSVVSNGKECNQLISLP